MMTSDTNTIPRTEPAVAASGNDAPSGRLVVLSGPSCVGKSPLLKALARLYPELQQDLAPLVLYNSRAPRPDEEDGRDYYFRKRATIKKLKDDERYVVMDVRGDLQAVDLEDLLKCLSQGSVFFEGNPFVGRVLMTHPKLEQVDKLGVFMAPLCRDEILFLSNPDIHAELEDLVTDIMRRKLLRRTARQKNHLGLNDLQNIETRAESAYRELQDASLFHYVIPNHDGEDSENWDAFYYPLGDARKALTAFVALLRGEHPPSTVEQWEENLLPS